MRIVGKSVGLTTGNLIMTEKQEELAKHRALADRVPTCRAEVVVQTRGFDDLQRQDGGAVCPGNCEVQACLKRKDLQAPEPGLPTPRQRS